MNRRDILRLTAHASSLVLAGRLPLLSAARQENRSRFQKQSVRQTASSRNIFFEPAAIEPVTGYMGKFHPVDTGSMQGNFSAKYDLIKWGPINNKTGKPRNSIGGSLEIARNVNRRDIVYETVEHRTGQTASRVTTKLNCRGKFDAAIKWTAISDVMNGSQAHPDLRFEEHGLVSNGNIIRTNKLGTVKSVSSHKLIPQEALLPLLAGNTVKPRDLHFDMLQGGLSIKSNQILHYGGQIQFPVAGRTASMDCYAQTGYGILPTHYLVDEHGRVQLITQENTNWALKELS